MESLLLPLNSSALDLSPSVIRAHASVMDPDKRLGARSEAKAVVFLLSCLPPVGTSQPINILEALIRVFGG